MYEIIDKLLLFLCCLILYLFEVNNNIYVVPVIIAVALSSLFVYYENGRVHLAGCMLYALLCIFFPGFIIFLPLVFYDILHTRYQYKMVILPILYINRWEDYSLMALSMTTMILLISYLLKFKTDRLKRIRSDYNELRDSSTAMSLLLEEKNQSLLKNQDFEINLATLNERNRISKEIHDNIGHLLSRALLQVGAMLTISKEEPVREGLSALKTSLSDGMDQIRSSIHNMYDESIDLYTQVEQLVKDFNFCPVHFEYDLNTIPNTPLKFAIIAIIKETLSNILRHTKATKVTLLLREHPAMYQLIIHDHQVLEENKAQKLRQAFEKEEFGDGMGLRNIYDRVKSFEGNINITVENGVKLFITFPKK
jgi:signal transduction histidine kinase